MRTSALATLVDEPFEAPFAGLLITEVQPGSVASASEEFIEIYNYSDQRIDFDPAYWSLAIASSGATKWTSPYRTVHLSGSIAPGGTYVIASEYKSGSNTVKYLPATAQAWFDAGLSATGGHVRLVYYNETGINCDMDTHVIDTVEWSAVNSAQQPVVQSIGGRTLYVAAGKAIDSQTSLQRTINALTGAYTDTGNDATDFSVAPPTPGTAAAYTGIASPMPWVDPSCVQPSQPSDPSDPPETTTPPPAGESDDEGPGNEDSVPGPGDGDDPEASTSEPANNVVLSPQISELLPNPASPQTDAADEYVELFNRNTTVFDISGYTLEVGETTKHRYVFPAGTILQPLAYKAFYITQTNVSLTNDMGSARLLDMQGVVLSATGVYDSAPEGKAWAYADGIWQWTATPTPNAANLYTVVPVVVAAPKKAATTTKKVTTAKTASVKAASTKKAATKAATTKKAAKTKQVKQVAAMKPVSETKRPIHGGILAAIGVIAVSYGAYEYRHEVANKVHQLRINRANRRKNRASA